MREGKIIVNDMTQVTVGPKIQKTALWDQSGNNSGDQGQQKGQTGNNSKISHPNPIQSILDPEPA